MPTLTRLLNGVLTIIIIGFGLLTVATWLFAAFESAFVLTIVLILIMIVNAGFEKATGA